MVELDHVGVLALELFEVDGALVANELAPRVHNSGHWTIEGAVTSQFEQHLRAILGLPLGRTSLIGPSAMVNLIGGEPDPAAVLAIPGAHLHRYGKAARPGRKIGHVTVVAAGVRRARRAPGSAARSGCDQCRCIELRRRIRSVGAGVGREEAGHVDAATLALGRLGERVVDPRVGLGRVHLHRGPGGQRLDAPEGAGERLAGAEQFGPAAVGIELPGPRHGHAEDARRDRRQEAGPEQDEGVGAVVAVAPAQHVRPERHVGEERDRRRDRGRDGADEDVTVLHVHQLVGQHTLELLARHLTEQAGGDGHDGVARVATSGERVGLLVGRDGDHGHGQVGPLGQRAHEGVELGRFSLGDDPGLGAAQGQLVAVPVRAADEGEREHEADDEAGRAAPAEQAGDGDDEGAEASEQGRGLEGVGEHGSSLSASIACRSRRHLPRLPIGSQQVPRISRDAGANVGRPPTRALEER